jgi:hypothetical protein
MIMYKKSIHNQHLEEKINPLLIFIEIYRPNDQFKFCIRTYLVYFWSWI